MSQSHEFIIILISTQYTIHAGHNAVLLERLAFLLASQAYRINIVLLSEAFRNALDWNNDSNIAVEAELLIRDIDAIIYKCTEEIALAKLHNLDWTLCSLV